MISNDGIMSSPPLARDAASRTPRSGASRSWRRTRAAPPISQRRRRAARVRAPRRGSHERRRLVAIRRAAPHASAEQLRKAGAARAVRAGLLDEDDDARERACGLVKEMTQLRSDLPASAPRLVKLLGNDEESPRAAARAVDAPCAGDYAVQKFVDLDTAPSHRWARAPLAGRRRVGATAPSSPPVRR